MVIRKDLKLGTIYKRQLTYGIVYQAKVRVLGITACKNFSKKLEAKKWISQKEQEIYRFNNIHSIECDLTLKELIEKYIQEIASYQKSKRAITNRWKFIICHYPALVSKQVRKIIPQDILNFRNMRVKDGKRTTNLDLVMFHSLFETAIKLWNLPIGINPVKYVKKFPETKGRYRPIYKREYLKILRYAKNYSVSFYLAILILKNTGIRPAELFNLNINDIDDIANVLVIRESKTNKSRIVPINKYICSLIYKKASKNYKIINLTYNGFTSAFSRMKIRLKLDNLHIYDFRRNFAQRFIDNKKGSIPALAKIGGWSSWEMVQRYYGKESIRND